MERQRQWEAILRVIHGVSMIEDLDDFGPTVLEKLDALIPSDLSSYNEVDPLARRARVVGRPITVTPDQVASWGRWSHQNPALMYMLRTDDGSAKRISDFLTPTELHRLELYTEVYRPVGVEYQLSVALPAPRPTVIGLALNRGHEDFSTEEVGLLDALRPHLVQAYRHAQLITEHRRALEQVSGALEVEGRAFHVSGEPLGGLALILLNRHFGASMDRLPDPVYAWMENERAGFAVGEPGRLCQPLISMREGRRLTVTFVPGGTGPDLLWLAEQPAELDAKPLERLGLSPREAEVLWVLTKGKSTIEIAEELSISSGTR